MKRKIQIIFSLLLIVSILASCFKEPSLVPVIATKRLSVATLKELYKGQTITLTEQNVGITPLAGTIVSDAASGNIESGKFVMVQSVIDERNDVTITAGITISLGDNVSTTFVPGDSVVFDIRGTTLTRENGSLQLRGVNVNKIYKVRSNCVVEPVLLTLKELSTNFDTYESMLVQITAADVIPIDGGNNYSGLKKLDDGSDAEDVNLYTLSTAVFAQETIPANANFMGIATYGNNVKQVRMRNTDGVTSTSISHHSPILITGFMSDPAGVDQSFGGGYLGGFEYVQLMATEDINFAVTPYSVVFSRNANSSTTVSPFSGWNSGRTRTFKFNLTSGTAAKNTFFYVGGQEKCIAGSLSATEKTTDISEIAPIPANRANWIRSKQMTNGSTSTSVVLGDDFGGSSTDWLYNQSGYLTGIGIFSGINVTDTTIPIDAVFFGDSGYASFRVFDAASLIGYLVPNNDWYRANDANGPQPFFKQGSNAYLYGGVQVTANIGNWAFLGGVYSINSHSWIAPRSLKYTPLMSSRTPIDQPQLADIETGPSVTKIRD